MGERRFPSELVDADGAFPLRRANGTGAGVSGELQMQSCLLSACRGTNQLLYPADRTAKVYACHIVA